MEINHWEALYRGVGLHAFPFLSRWGGSQRLGFVAQDPIQPLDLSHSADTFIYRVVLIFSKMLWWLGTLPNNQRLYFWGFSQHSTTLSFMIICQKRRQVYHYTIKQTEVYNWHMPGLSTPMTFLLLWLSSDFHLSCPLFLPLSLPYPSVSAQSVSGSRTHIRPFLHFIQ